ncbi:MAG: cyclodeaminase/cyclohydrolase family protein [Thermoplasmata archaeon]|nr:MAG: cyclodeaminase/cyclohydrolase family protein [Thermoplasmata archaeon]
MFGDETVKDFLEKVADSSPTPGGGTAAALVGSLASALSEMVCNLTIGKEKYKDVEDEIKKERGKCMEYRKKLTALMDDDARAFNKVMEAFRIPKEREGRKEVIQEAYKEAASVPLATAEYCLKVMESARKIAEKGNKNSITDAGSSVVLANAAFRSAIFNVRINLSGIKDENFVGQTEKKIAAMEEKVEEIMKEAMHIVEECL